MVWFATKRLSGFGGMLIFLWQKRRSGALSVLLINRLNLCPILNTSNQTIELIYL